MSLLLADSGQDAVQVLLRLLLVRTFAAQQQFTRLAGIAGLIFIGNAQRDDVQLQEIRFKPLRPAHVKHLQQTLLGGVQAVFRAAFALRDPDRRAPRNNALADIIRQPLRTQIQLAGLDAADDLDHAVGPHKILY